MIRGWILFATLVFSVLFKLWPDYSGTVTFLFSRETLNMQSWVYYMMEHVISSLVAACLLIKDNTPRWILYLFFALMVADLLHFFLFYRDTGIGFNLVKVIIFGSALSWTQLKS